MKLTDANRGGILAMPGILATTSFPNRTSPVKRGVWVLEQVLGEHVPPAPPNVPALEKQDKEKVANLTLRQRTELHRTERRRAPTATRFSIRSASAWRTSTPSGAGATRTIPAARSTPRANCRAENASPRPQELKAIIAARKDDFCPQPDGKAAGLRPVPPAGRLRRDRGRSPDGNRRQGRLSHADAHRRGRDQLSFHPSSCGRPERGIQCEVT